MPHSLLWRQNAFEEQRVILDKYSFPSAVLDSVSVAGKLKEQAASTYKKEYLVEKAFRRHQIDQQDAKQITRDLSSQADLQPPKNRALRGHMATVVLNEDVK